MTRSPIEPPNNPNASASRSSDDRPVGAAGARSSSRRSLTFDEGIALLVAFLSLGSVLFWGLTRGGMNLMNEVVADADTSALALNEGNANPAILGFGEGDSEIASAERATAAKDGKAGLDQNKDKGREPAATDTEPTSGPRRILEDVRTGVAGAAAGIAGTVATSEGVEAKPAETDQADTAEETGAAEETAAADSPAVDDDAPEASAPPEPASLSAAATGEAKDAIAFEDVPDNYWAKPYIDALSSRGLISGFDDGNFRPDQPVNRAQIATIVSRTFDLTSDQENLAFSDIENNFWAKESIGEVVRGGFMKGFPNETFAPNDPVTRTQALTTLVTGLGLQPPTNVQASIDRYTDANNIPSWANEKVAAATAGGLVVNYPNQQSLNPNQPTTRAELSAMIYQALVKEGAIEPLESEYVVKP
ncbi:MAG: S-layer homology domain-containing protein [Phormidesmis sp.]